jgi:hypothetical protein
MNLLTFSCSGLSIISPIKDPGEFDRTGFVGDVVRTNVE